VSAGTWGQLVTVVVIVVALCVVVADILAGCRDAYIRRAVRRRWADILPDDAPVIRDPETGRAPEWAARSVVVTKIAVQPPNPTDHV
jgi:hypothetical protein